jgi:hypothetical protein
VVDPDLLTWTRNGYDRTPFVDELHPLADGLDRRFHAAQIAESPKRPVTLRV